jgi:hypothetical protein
MRHASTCVRSDANATSSEPRGHIILVAAIGENTSLSPSRCHCALPRLQSSRIVARPVASSVIV